MLVTLSGSKTLSRQSHPWKALLQMISVPGFTVMLATFFFLSSPGIAFQKTLAVAAVYHAELVRDSTGKVLSGRFGRVIVKLGAVVDSHYLLEKLNPVLRAISEELIYVRNTYVSQRSAPFKILLADVFYTVWNVDTFQRPASFKSAVADVCDAVGEYYVFQTVAREESIIADDSCAGFHRVACDTIFS